MSLIRAARAGRPSDQLQLGRLFIWGGEGLAPNPEAAYLWLARASEQGCEEACRLIGESIPAHVVPDPTKAARWYAMAAAAGSAHAQRVLAHWQIHGALRKSSVVLDEPVKLLRQAASQGDIQAQVELGSVLLAGANDTDESPQEAVEWLQRAAAAGNARATRLVAAHFWQTHDLERAQLWYSRCPRNANDAESDFRLGALEFAIRGDGSLSLLRAADKGHAQACHELGLRYAVGLWGGEVAPRRRKRNYKKAVRWLEKAASLGSAEACLALWSLYRHGEFAHRDRSIARYWLLQGARRGLPEAQYRAGVELWRQYLVRRSASLVLDGVHYPEADVEAVRLLSSAARQGYARAMQQLHSIASFAIRPSDEVVRSRAASCRLVAQKSPAMAIRMELAGALALNRREMLLVDPVAGDRGFCFVVDLCSGCRRSTRRIIVLDNAYQREVVDRAKQILGGDEWLAKEVQGRYQARYQRFWYLCRRTGVEWSAFEGTSAPASDFEHFAHARA